MGFRGGESLMKLESKGERSEMGGRGAGVVGARVRKTTEASERTPGAEMGEGL